MPVTRRIRGIETAKYNQKYALPGPYGSAMLNKDAVYASGKNTRPMNVNAFILFASFNETSWSLKACLFPLIPARPVIEALSISIL